MTMRRFLFCAATALVLLAPQLAVAGEPAVASLNVVRSLSIASVRPIQLTSAVQRPLGIDARGLAGAPAIIRIAGDPGRVYRIRAPAILRSPDGEAVVDDLRLWSVNAGDVSSSRVARMDVNGHDVLRITGRLKSAASGRASLPISIDYE